MSKTEHKVILSGDTRSHRAEFDKSIEVNKKFSLSLQSLTAQTKLWATKTRAQANMASKAITGFATISAGALTVTAGALTAVYAKNAEFIDQQAKTADRLGVTTQALTGLQHAAEQTGASTETLNMGLQRMTRRIADQSAEAQKGLEILGLTFDELKGKSPDQQFALIADAMQRVTDQGQKVAATQKLFDSEGVKLLNTLALGSDGLKVMINEAEALGFAFDRVDAAKVEIANDALDRAKKVTHQFGLALTTETAPIVAGIADLWTESANQAGGFGNVMQEVITNTAKGVGFIGDTLHGIKIIFKTLELSAFGFSTALWQGLAFVVNDGIVPFTNHFIKGVISPIRKIIEWSQNIPGIGDAAKDALIALNQLGNDVGFEGFEMLDNVSNQAFRNLAEKRNEFHDLIMEPIPSQKIETWIGNVQTKFGDAAKNAAANSKFNPADFFSNVERSNSKNEGNNKKDPRIQSALSRYQKIYDEQLKLEGKEIQLQQNRYKRQKELMDSEFNELEQHYGSIAALEQRIEEERAFTKANSLFKNPALHDQSEVHKLEEKLALMQELESKHKLAQEQAAMQHAQKLTDIEMQQSQARAQIKAVELNNYSQLFGNIASLTSAFGGKQSKLYKGLFAASKAFAVAESIVKIQQGIASAAAMPFPTNIPAMASVAASTVGIVSTIQSTKMNSYDGGGYTGDGPRIGGVDGKGGMFAIVHPQETVVDHTKGQKLGTNIVVNIHEDASKAGQVSQRSLSEQDVIDVWVSNIQQGGEAATAAELTWDLKRQGY